MNAQRKTFISLGFSILGVSLATTTALAGGPQCMPRMQYDQCVSHRGILTAEIIGLDASINQDNSVIAGDRKAADGLQLDITTANGDITTEDGKIAAINVDIARLNTEIADNHNHPVLEAKYETDLELRQAEKLTDDDYVSAQDNLITSDTTAMRADRDKAAALEPALKALELKLREAVSERNSLVCKLCPVSPH